MTSGSFPRMTWTLGLVRAFLPVAPWWGPDLHGYLDLLRSIQALGQVLLAATAVGVGEGVASSAAPGHSGVSVIHHRIWRPVMQTSWSHWEPLGM